VAQKWRSLQPYSKPTINNRGGDLTKQWYITFYYYSQSQNKLVRAKRSRLPGLPSPNRIKNKSQRTAQLQIIADAIELLLARGWTPEQQINFDSILEQQGQFTLISALKKCTAIKANEVAKRTANNYNFTCKSFIEYLKAENLSDLLAQNCTRAIVTKYLRLATAGKGAKTRNNYLGNLHVLFEKMIEEEIILKNPCHGIKKVVETSSKHTAYSPEQLKLVMQHLQQHNQQMFYYILVIGYAFLRCSETLSLKVENVDLNDRFILLSSQAAKRNQFEKIPIIEKLMPTMQALVKGKGPKDYLFNEPGNFKRPVYGTGYFSKRFKTVKKHLNRKGANLGRNHDIYSTRHTFIQDLYQSARQTLSQREAEFLIMPITRHKTVEALRKYIRDYHLELPKDWGGLYRNKF
jgi:integrase